MLLKFRIRLLLRNAIFKYSERSEHNPRVAKQKQDANIRLEAFLKGKWYSFFLY